VKAIRKIAFLKNCILVALVKQTLEFPQAFEFSI